MAATRSPEALQGATHPAVQPEFLQSPSPLGQNFTPFPPTLTLQFFSSSAPIASHFLEELETIRKRLPHAPNLLGLYSRELCHLPVQRTNYPGSSPVPGLQVPNSRTFSRICSLRCSHSFPICMQTGCCLFHLEPVLHAHLCLQFLSHCWLPSGATVLRGCLPSHSSHSLLNSLQSDRPSRRASP